MPGLEQVDPRKIWKNYVLAILLILSLVSVSHFAEVFVDGNSARLVSDINTSGRQRMLSQRILYFAASYHRSGYADATSREQLVDAVDLFESAHATLTADLSDMDLRDIYFTEQPDRQLDADTYRFIRDARIVIDSSDRAERDAALLDMESFGAGPLLQKLNEAVRIYEHIAQQHAVRVSQSATVGYVLALIAILGVSIFVFRPTHATIITAFDELSEAKAALERRERAAFSALEEAEEAWAEAETARVAVETSYGQAQARLANVGYELAAPMAALRASVEAANSARSQDARVDAARSALNFVEITERMREHMMPSAEPSSPHADIADDTGSETCNINGLLQMAVGTVTACSPDKAAITLSLPSKKSPTVVCDSLALFRCIVHFLRDAQDQPGTADIWLDADIDGAEQNATLAIDVTQTLETGRSEASDGTGLVDKKLSDDNIRALILDELVSELGGKGVVTTKEMTRNVNLSIPVALQYQSNAAPHAPRRAWGGPAGGPQG